jgi:DNA-directed RNA polymerase sigma subunit (sigma70/sigma32)
MISKLLYKLPDLDRRILIKKYGIGLPFPMSINEISENENISVNKIKYIINNSIKILQRHINDDDRKVMNELL